MSNSGRHEYSAQPTRVRPRRGLDESEFQDRVNEAMYESDEFRMYEFKVTMCPRIRSHHWTSCPFAHRGERARRRNPRQYNYAAIPCPNFKTGDCTRGDACQFAHGVFEYWLHPARYRTRLCHSSVHCRRRVCFFAHTPAELRPETKYQWCYVYRPVATQPYAGVDVGEASTSGVVVPYAPQPQPVPVPQPSHVSLNIREGTSSHEVSSSSTRWPHLQDPDLPDIQWVSDLVDEK